MLITLAFALSDITVAQAVMGMLVLQSLIAVAYRTSWVQQHEGVKKALEAEQRFAGVVRGALNHAIDNHQDGDGVEKLAKDYLVKNGVEDLAAKVLEPPKQP